MRVTHIESFPCDKTGNASRKSSPNGREKSSAMPRSFYYQAQPEQADQQRPPDRSPPCAPHSPQPSREGDAHEAADEEVGDLLPTMVAQFKVAHKVPSDAVAG